ncbi:hypothetical protein [Streptomyces sp. NPDC003036]|uniref:hypothetical protein n=1 Tax=Streptomyces sp. NPDC003036 TaxID=3154442 RepID=UPI0033AECCC6
MATVDATKKPQQPRHRPPGLVTSYRGADDMRDLIALLPGLLLLLGGAALLLLLNPSTKSPGRHSAEYVPPPRVRADLSPSIWLAPWETPQPQHVTERSLPFEDELPAVRPYVAGFPPPSTEEEWRRERRRAAAFAQAGMDYAYTYPGAPIFAEVAP